MIPEIPRTFQIIKITNEVQEDVCQILAMNEAEALNLFANSLDDKYKTYKDLTKYLEKGLSYRSLLIKDNRVFHPTDSFNQVYYRLNKGYLIYPYAEPVSTHSILMTNEDLAQLIGKLGGAEDKNQPRFIEIPISYSSFDMDDKYIHPDFDDYILIKGAKIKHSFMVRIQDINKVDIERNIYKIIRPYDGQFQE